MGALFVKPFRVNTLPGQGEDVFYVAKKLNLSTHHLNQIYAQFRYLDSDNSGVIDVNEFIITNCITSEIFGELVFSLFDANKSGKLDFEEYLIAIWNYCSLSKDGLAKFAFDIFDVDNSGSLTIEEIKDVISIIWGNENNDRVAKVLKSLNGIKSSSLNEQLTSEQFIETSKRFPNLLFPVFEVQEKLCVRGLGRRIWSKISDERYKAFGDKSVFEILEFETKNAETIEYIARKLTSTMQVELIRKMSTNMKSKSAKKLPPKVPIIKKKIEDDAKNNKANTAGTKAPPAINTSTATGINSNNGSNPPTPLHKDKASPPPLLKIEQAIESIRIRNAASAEQSPQIIILKSPASPGRVNLIGNYSPKASPHSKPMIPADYRASPRVVMLPTASVSLDSPQSRARLSMASPTPAAGGTSTPGGILTQRSSGGSTSHGSSKGNQQQRSNTASPSPTSRERHVSYSGVSNNGDVTPKFNSSRVNTLKDTSGKNNRSKSPATTPSFNTSAASATTATTTNVVPRSQLVPRDSTTPRSQTSEQNNNNNYNNSDQTVTNNGSSTPSKLNSLIPTTPSGGRFSFTTMFTTTTNLPEEKLLTIDNLKQHQQQQHMISQSPSPSPSKRVSVQFTKGINNALQPQLSLLDENNEYVPSSPQKTRLTYKTNDVPNLGINNATTTATTIVYDDNGHVIPASGRRYVRSYPSPSQASASPSASAMFNNNNNSGLSSGRRTTPVHSNINSARDNNTNTSNDPNDQLNSGRRRRKPTNYDVTTSRENSARSSNTNTNTITASSLLNLEDFNGSSITGSNTVATNIALQARKQRPSLIINTSSENCEDLSAGTHNIAPVYYCANTPQIYQKNKVIPSS